MPNATDVRRILCPVDGSDFTAPVLTHALALARWYGASVTALHVMAPWIPAGRLASHRAWEGPVEEMRRAEMDHLHALIAPLTAGAPVEVTTSEGDPAKEIVAYAGDRQIDLVVMGTHGRSGFDRFALGSVAEKVLRKAPCPVLTLPESAIQHAGELAYGHILCATDFSEAADAGLRFAGALAIRAGARMTVVHAIDGSEAFEVPRDVPLTAEGLRQQEDDSVRRRLHAAVASFVRGDVDVEEVVVRGKAHHQILDLAAERAIDVIVMGVQGRGAVDLSLFGSTTNQVVRRATCPVLTVRGRRGH